MSRTCLPIFYDTELELVTYCTAIQSSIITYKDNKSGSFDTFRVLFGKVLFYRGVFPVEDDFRNVFSRVKKVVISPFIPVNRHCAVFIHTE